ncbi:MAG: hypothetical protein WC073_11290 [Sterolibacterium sp.]
MLNKITIPRWNCPTAERERERIQAMIKAANKLPRLPDERVKEIMDDLRKRQGA